MLALCLLLGFLGTHLLPELLLLCQPHPLCLEAPPVLRKGAATWPAGETCSPCHSSAFPPPPPPQSPSSYKRQLSWSPGHSGSGIIGSQSQTRCVCLLKFTRDLGLSPSLQATPRLFSGFGFLSQHQARDRETPVSGSTHLDTTHSWGLETSPQPGGAGVAGGQSCLGHRPAR